VKTEALRVAACAALAVLPLGCVDEPPKSGADMPGYENDEGFLLSSLALSDSRPIPPEYACADEQHLGKSPPLSWNTPPADTRAFAITVVDTSAGNFMHWAAVNLPPSTRTLEAGASHTFLPTGSLQLLNDFGKLGYGGPCPPRGSSHVYAITVYALKAPVTGVAAGTRAPRDLDSRLRRESLANASITVTFAR
jgi:Raf kinase inhibitor-like YbhB/YbcL family protein